MHRPGLNSRLYVIPEGHSVLYLGDLGNPQRNGQVIILHNADHPTPPNAMSNEAPGGLPGGGDAWESALASKFFIQSEDRRGLSCPPSVTKPPCAD